MQDLHVDGSVTQLLHVSNVTSTDNHSVRKVVIVSCIDSNTQLSAQIQQTNKQANKQMKKCIAFKDFLHV